MTSPDTFRHSERARLALSGTLAGEFARYFVAGLLALGIDFTLYVGLTEIAGWHYLVSATAAFCAGRIGISNHLFPDARRYRRPEKKSSADKRGGVWRRFPALNDDSTPESTRIA